LLTSSAPERQAPGTLPPPNDDPEHRLAIYNRNLDWFRFWLQDYEDPDPAKTEQYARWRQFRAKQRATGETSTH